MSELRVRDHSRPCEHGFRHPHGWVTAQTDLNSSDGASSGWEFCYGGKEIVLRLVDSIGQHGTTLKIVSPRMWVEVVEE